MGKIIFYSLVEIMVLYEDSLHCNQKIIFQMKNYLAFLLSSHWAEVTINFREIKGYWIWVTVKRIIKELSEMLGIFFSVFWWISFKWHFGYLTLTSEGRSCRVFQSASVHRRSELDFLWKHSGFFLEGTGLSFSYDLQWINPRQFGIWHLKYIWT